MLQDRPFMENPARPVRQDSLLSMMEHRVRILQPNADIHAGRRNGDNVYVILDGWAIRYCTFADGRRQISAILIAGDICHLDILSDMPADTSVSTVTSARIGAIPRRELRALMDSNPVAARGLWWEMFSSASLQQEWTINVGRRTAGERLGHLFCEIYARLQAIDQVHEYSCHLPLTQSDLGDMMGLTPVHINRTLQQLRANDLVALNRRWLTIPDLPALQRYSLFDPRYLNIPQVKASRSAMADLGAATVGGRA